MPCIDAAVTVAVEAIPVLATLDARQAVDAINAAGVVGGAIEPTGASAAIAAVADWLLAVSWQLLPLAAIVIILDFALRRAGPVVRSALWWMVLAKLIVPPGLASPVSIAQLWPATATSATAAAEDASASAALAATGPTAATVASTAIAAVAATLAAGATPPTPATAADAVSAADAADAAGAGTSSRLLLWMLLTMWAAGVIAAAIVACWRYRRVRAACLQDASPLADAAPDVYDTVAVAAARRLGLAALPPIVVASPAARAAGLPAVIGFFRPCIVLPRTLLDRPRVEIEHVLLHELAHVRRRDPLASLACLVAQIVFWFHPAIWCARRRLATLREMACDRTVARLLGDGTSAYRRTLILLARTAALGAPPPVSASAFASASGLLSDGPGALGLFQRQSQLVTRLDALARPVSMRRATECAACAAIALAILVSCVPLASPRAAPIASIDVPPLDQLPGSLQKRYAVMRALALEEQARAQQPSR